MAQSSQPLAIYEKKGQYIVKPYGTVHYELWAILGRDYTPETAQVLADALNEGENDHETA